MLFFLAFIVKLFGFQIPRCLIFKKPSFFCLRKMVFFDRLGGLWKQTAQPVEKVKFKV